MRLINVHTLRIDEFFGDKIPNYIILSHTWGKDEVSFQDWADLDKASRKAGYTKIRHICDEVRRSSTSSHVWVDTCCIDKTSSAELSEAINSMYAWYKGARVCCAYLADVPSVQSPPRDVAWRSDALRHFPHFANSRWFTRGWTLQEFLAPKELRFYSQDWIYIGNKHMTRLAPTLARITGIEPRYFQGREALANTSIAQKMSWAAKRQTERVEDAAYCLLGIFDINMPLLYGEGKRAFQRLQEQIIKVSDDESIFCWGSPLRPPPATWSRWTSILAPSPDAFAESMSCFTLYDEESRGHGVEMTPYALTNSGLHITIQAVDMACGILAILNVSFLNDRKSRKLLRHVRLAIPLRRCGRRNLYERASGSLPVLPVGTFGIPVREMSIYVRCRGAAAPEPASNRCERRRRLRRCAFGRSLCLLTFDPPTDPTRGRIQALGGHSQIRIADRSIGLYLNPARREQHHYDEAHSGLFLLRFGPDREYVMLAVAQRLLYGDFDNGDDGDSLEAHDGENDGEVTWFVELAEVTAARPLERWEGAAQAIMRSAADVAKRGLLGHWCRCPDATPVRYPDGRPLELSHIHVAPNLEWRWEDARKDSNSGRGGHAGCPLWQVLEDAGTAFELETWPRGMMPLGDGPVVPVTRKIDEHAAPDTYSTPPRIPPVEMDTKSDERLGMVPCSPVITSAGRDLVISKPSIIT